MSKKSILENHYADAITETLSHKNSLLSSGLVVNSEIVNEIVAIVAPGREIKESDIPAVPEDKVSKSKLRLSKEQLERIEEKKRRVIKNTIDLMQPAEHVNATSNLQTLFETNFCLGESHSDAAPKKFLIENMELLKENGYTTLFMEHLFYDGPKGEEMKMVFGVEQSRYPTDLESHLKQLDQGFHVADENYGFLALVKKAKECGIKIVGIDTSDAYKKMGRSGFGGASDGNARYLAMNLAAKLIIEKEESGKWFSLMGNAHIKEMDGIPGVADLLGATAIDIFTDKSLTATQISCQNTSRNVAEVVLRSDIKIACAPTEPLKFEDLCRILHQQNLLQKTTLESLDLAIPKKPSLNVEKSYVEKMVVTSRSGVNEI